MSSEGYPLGATDLADWLSENYERPQSMSPQTLSEIFFQYGVPHIDIFDGAVDGTMSQKVVRISLVFKKFVLGN